jgi:hypothetical protein
MEASTRKAGIVTRRIGSGSSRRSRLLFLLGLLIVCAAFSILELDDATVDSLVREDGVVEWSGAIGLFIGSALLLASFAMARRRRPVDMTPGGVWILLASAAVLFALGGEEISWGQRLFGWGTPAALEHANAQDETNLHNLGLFQGTTLDGDRLFRVAWICFFVLLPLAAWAWPRIRRAVAPRVLIAPAWMAGLFFCTWIATTLAVDAFDGVYNGIYATSSAATEIQEALVELLMGLWALLTLQRVRGAAASRRSARE